MFALIRQIQNTVSWQSLPELSQTVIEQAVTIQQIPAPTFHEQQRAAYLEDQFRALGLEQVETDSVYNVYGLLRGSDSEHPGIIVSAHTDTVFPADTDLTTRQEAGIIFGPGLGDNSFGVAGLYGLAKMLKDQSITPASNIWFVATSGEEGLGDLGGIKAAFSKLRDQIRAVINVEGLAFGHVYHAGIAVRRLHITASAAGGHSWLHFGRQSAIHAIVNLGARITTLNPPNNPRTTYNIGLLEGGQSINSIAMQAGLWLDMRSVETHALAALESQVRAQIESLITEELKFQIEIVGDRPTGSIPPDHPLVAAAITVLNQLNIQETLEIGSTDANIPLAAGCPAVTIGITRGGHAHRLDEFVETEYVSLGMQQLILLTLAAAASDAF